MTLSRFKLPDVGEGLTEAEVVTWYVAVDDTVAINDILCDIETAKSVVELPSPVAGVVDELLVDTGQTVPVGTALVSFRSSVEPAATEPSQAPSPEQPEPEPNPEPKPDPEPAAPLVLVGTGPSASSPRRRHLSRPTEPDAARGGPEIQAPDRETRIAISGVRRATAKAMVSSAFTAPHVTEWLTVDATETVELVRRLRQHPAWTGIRLTLLVFVAHALIAAVRANPEINARWDEAAGQIVQQHYVNLGIATATARGLIVPNIKDADRLSLVDLAGAINDLVATARAGQTTPATMSQGTITLTNIGALGVDAGTPILNPGEAAILAMGSARQQPWVVDGEVRVRHVMTLALSFDHRLVDGELGSRVLTSIGDVVSDPTIALAGSRMNRGG